MTEKVQSDRYPDTEGNGECVLQVPTVGDLVDNEGYDLAGVGAIRAYIDKRREMSAELEQVRQEMRDINSGYTGSVDALANTGTRYTSRLTEESLMGCNLKINSLTEEISKIDRGNWELLRRYGDAWMELLLERNKSKFIIDYDEADYYRSKAIHPELEAKVGDGELRLTSSRVSGGFNKIWSSHEWRVVYCGNPVVWSDFKISYDFGDNASSNELPPKTISASQGQIVFDELKGGIHSLRELYLAIFANLT